MNSMLGVIDVEEQEESPIVKNVKRCGTERIMKSAEKRQRDREYQKEYYKKNRTKVLARQQARAEAKIKKIEDIKATTPCMDCGRRFPPECMDFDHRDGEEKKFHISQSRWHSWKKIETEMSKCDLVCANCHRIRTRKRGIVNQYT